MRVVNPEVVVAISPADALLLETLAGRMLEAFPKILEVASLRSSEIVTLTEINFRLYLATLPNKPKQYCLTSDLVVTSENDCFDFGNLDSEMFKIIEGMQPRAFCHLLGRKVGNMLYVMTGRKFRFGNVQQPQGSKTDYRICFVPA